MDIETRIDSCLSTRSGHLYIEDCDTIRLIREFGSPLFVFSEDQLRRNIHRFQQAFQKGWPDGPVKVLPAERTQQATSRTQFRDEVRKVCRFHHPGIVVVFDYGEFGSIDPAGQLFITPAEQRPWTLRPDPFSSHRAGFDIRTRRRCNRVLMFHHIASMPVACVHCVLHPTVQH